MQTSAGSLFTFAAGRRAKWIVFAIWFVAIFIAAGPANLPGKFEDAESNEATSYLPGDAESTAALNATESLQNGEIAPAVIIFRRDSGLTAADRRTIVEDVGKMTAKRFPGVVPDGATAAAGGKPQASQAGSPRPRREACRRAAAARPARSPASPPATRPSSARSARRTARRRSSPPTSRATARANGSSTRSSSGANRSPTDDGGLEAKITGGAGFSADAIEVFEGINGTLLLAALSLVIFLLIVIYRSPMFFLIPLLAVLFAETLSRSLGYGLTELGVTVNGQSSSIMSVLVLGAGTDYALLLVSRYREELHHTVDKHEAMRTALASAGPAIFASAATVIAALLLPDAGQGQRHRRPRPDRRDGHRLRGALDADPAAGAADDLRPPRLLALRPAHAGDRSQRRVESPSEHGAKIVDGSGASAPLVRVVLACLLVLVLLPLVLLNWLLRVLSGRRIPSLIVGPLDRAIFTPYEIRRHRLEHAADATHGFWKRVGDRIAVSPRRVMGGSIAVLLVLCGGLAFFSTDLTSEDTYRTEVESVEGQHLLDKSFPSGTTALTDVVVPSAAEVHGGAQARWRKASTAVEAVSRTGRRGPPGTSWSRRPSNPTPTRPRPSTWSNRSARQPTRFDRRPWSAARPRSNSTSATRPAGTRS